MSGIYIHIPYCKQKCSYCNFHFSTILSSMDALCEALVQEIELRKSELTSPIKTVYFGGGTPSLLGENQIRKLWLALQNNFELSQVQEFTLECNPEDVTKENLALWKSISVNRLSLGIQSFLEEELVFMNRAHSAEQAKKSIELAQEFEFQNLTIDLIYGSPLSTDAIWLENLNHLSSYNIPHFSAYALTVEPKTQLAHQIEKKKVSEISDEKQLRHFEMLQEFAQEKGYQQYEVSNFAQKNHEAIHNSSYWKGAAYLGIGPSAHSYDGGYKRTYTIANNAKYIQALNEGRLPQTLEELSPAQKFNELIMIGLRSSYGISENEIHAFPPTLVAHFQKEIAHYLEKNIIEWKNHYYYLKPEYYFRADGIASDLFYVK